MSCGAIKNVTDNRSVKEKVASQRYTFRANYVIPSSIGFQPNYLTSDYDLKVTPDTIQAHLPFFGRVYEAPINLSDAGINFTSTNFDYQLSQDKKHGNWVIDIKIKDQNREIKLTLDVWDNGKGDLRVLDQNKQAISYQGELQ